MYKMVLVVGYWSCLLRDGANRECTNRVGVRVEVIGLTNANRTNNANTESWYSQSQVAFVGCTEVENSLE